VVVVAVKKEKKQRIDSKREQYAYLLWVEFQGM
jgi:hypothetical protein